MIERLQRWAHGFAQEGRYTPVGIAFHWVMAALVLFQLGWGWYLGWLPAGGGKLIGYQIHSDVGLLILLLAALRLVWRTIVPDPINDADDLGWQTTIANLTHIVFYICFFGLPLTGWAMWSALGESDPLAIAGVIPWPPLPFHNLPVAVQWAVLDWAEGLHAFLVVTLTILVPLHVGAALKHHFWDRHDVLRGMLPQIPDWEDRRARRTRKPPAPQLPKESEAG